MNVNSLLETPSGASFRDLDSTLKECIARFGHPSDPLAAWKTSFDEWIERVKNFQQAEDQHIYQSEQPDEVTWRYHRFLLHSLIGRGEHLALQLLSLTAPEEEKDRLLGSLDTFLSDLRLTVETWHKVGGPVGPNPMSRHL
jgi:hypothetical protein